MEILDLIPPGNLRTGAQSLSEWKKILVFLQWDDDQFECLSLDTFLNIQKSVELPSNALLLDLSENLIGY